MTRRIFITGTSTDVGKTVVTRAIVRALVNRQVKLHAVKPVESGVPPQNGILHPHDGEALLQAAKSSRTLSQTCRYLFSAPVSPHLAARIDNATIDENELHRFLTEAEKEVDLLLIEGAGGLLVPLGDRLLYGDFVARAKCELMIVVPNVLGAINMALLTIEAARSRGIEVMGVVLNRGENESLQNSAAIAAFGDVPILGTFPETTDHSDEALAACAESHIDLSRFMVP